MENLLNLDGGWEAVVNDPQRLERINAFHERRYQARMIRMARKAAAAGTVCMGGIALAVTGALTLWVALPLTVISAGYCCFVCGRICESGR